MESRERIIFGDTNTTLIIQDRFLSFHVRLDIAVEEVVAKLIIHAVTPDREFSVESAVMEENLISSNCIRKDQCQYKVVWVGIIVASTVYIFVLMYIRELSKVIKILFIWPFTRRMKQRNLQEPLLGEDNKKLNSP